jgi:dTDP-glucose pyrophosphorylase
MPAALQHPDDITVLIPAAGRVPEGILALSNISCTALIPVAGRPVIFWTLRYLRSLGLRRFRIAVPQRGLFVEDFVECTVGNECEYEFVVPPTGPEGGLGETVATLLDGVRTPAALIVLGDTSFQFVDPEVLNRAEPLVLTATVNESYRWCVAESDAQGRLVRLRDKEVGLPPPLEALIGVYYFPNAELARQAARQALRPIADAPTGRTKIELISVLNRVHSQTPIRVLRAGAWMDVGNVDRQAGANVELLQKREFNALSIDPVLSTITKHSRLKAKFFDEINYFRLLPKDLAVLFPRVLDFSLDWDNLSVTLEYYGYSTLAEVFVYENTDPGIWENVFTHLFKILTQGFMRYRQPLSPSVVIDMYLHKTAQRFEQLNGTPELEQLKLAEQPVIINGRPCPSIKMIWPRLEADVRRLSEAVTGCIIHGDLCFSNILYDLRSGVCKFVDPRGSFGHAGITGDQRYDVAKLYHSVYGLYDFITNDLFHVRVQGLEVTLDVRARPQHRKILERFERVFFPHFDRREIMLITALIFVGIPALHYDQPNRQLAMLATAMQIFAELYPIDTTTSAAKSSVHP